MKTLLRKQSYNAGDRPSGHKISEQGFLTDNSGAIPRSFLEGPGVESAEEGHTTTSLVSGNTTLDPIYRDWCLTNGIKSHPATMSPLVCEFFINFLTEPKDLVFDPFGGSCTTGASAERLNRKWVNIEPNKEYLQGALGRFQQK